MVDHGESMDDSQPSVPATDDGSVILAEGQNSSIPNSEQQDLFVSTVQQELAATGRSHMHMPSAQPRTSLAATIRPPHATPLTPQLQQGSEATTDGMVYALSLVCIFLWTDIFYAHYSCRRS